MPCRNCTSALQKLEYKSPLENVETRQCQHAVLKLKKLEYKCPLETVETEECQDAVLKLKNYSKLNNCQWLVELLKTEELLKTV